MSHRFWIKLEIAVLALVCFGGDSSFSATSKKNPCAFTLSHDLPEDKIQSLPSDEYCTDLAHYIRLISDTDAIFLVRTPQAPPVLVMSHRRFLSLPAFNRRPRDDYAATGYRGVMTQAHILADQEAGHVPIISRYGRPVAAVIGLRLFKEYYAPEDQTWALNHVQRSFHKVLRLASRGIKIEITVYRKRAARLRSVTVVYPSWVQGPDLIEFERNLNEMVHEVQTFKKTFVIYFKGKALILEPILS